MVTLHEGENGYVNDANTRAKLKQNQIFALTYQLVMDTNETDDQNVKKPRKKRNCFSPYFT